MPDESASSKSKLPALSWPPSSDELERAYGLAPHLLRDRRYRRTAFGGAQFLCLFIAGIAPLIGCYAWGWSASTVVIALVIDAWSVHLGDLLVIVLADQGQRRARHRLGLRQYVLSIARRAIALLDMVAPVRFFGSILKIFVDLPGAASIALSAMILMFFTAPIFAFAAITLRDHPDQLKLGWIILFCLLSVAVRLAAASRIGAADRRDEVSYPDLLPQGYLVSLALFAAGCAWSIVVINLDHRLSHLALDFYAGLAFFVAYLVALVVMGVALLRGNRDEEKLLGRFLAVPHLHYQRQLTGVQRNA